MATPGYVWHFAAPMQIPITGSSTSLTMSCIHPSLAGNTLVLVISMNNSGSMAVTGVTDDKSQTWTKFDEVTTGGNSNYAVWSFKNTVADVRKVTVTLNVNNNFINFSLAEWFNVDTTTPLLTATHNDIISAGTSWSAGSISPASGDVIYSIGFFNGAQPYDTTGNATPGSGFQLVATDAAGGMYSQFRTAPGGALNPTITAPTSGTAMVVAFSLKASSSAQGSDRTGLRIKKVQGSNYNSVPSTHHYQFPQEGNLQVLLATTNNQTISSVTSSGSSYASVSGSPQNGPSGGGHVYQMAITNVTPSLSNNGTITMTADPVVGPAFWFLDIMGADTSPVGVTEGVTGTQSVAGNLSTHTSLTPTGGGTQLFIDIVDHASGSENYVTDSNMTQLIPYNGQDGGAIGDWTMDSGMAVILTSSAVTSTYTRSATAAGGWEAVGAFYKEPAAGGGAQPPYQPWQGRAPVLAA